jgi:hypothetical protein
MSEEHESVDLSGWHAVGMMFVMLGCKRQLASDLAQSR